MRRVIPGVVLLLGIVQAAQGGWIHAKALLAQVLLESAWQRTLAGETEVRPWSWADTWPVARLRFPDQGASMVVLEGASDRVMAFAPGRLHGSAYPGQPGACVIAGHRDTHFAVLEKVKTGDLVLLEDAAATLHEYRVTGTAVVDQNEVGVLECDDERCLVLVTCWPFAAIQPGSHKRFVVLARTDICAPSETIAVRGRINDGLLFGTGYHQYEVANEEWIEKGLGPFPPHPGRRLPVNATGKAPRVDHDVVGVGDCRQLTGQVRAPGAREHRVARSAVPSQMMLIRDKDCQRARLCHPAQLGCPENRMHLDDFPLDICQLLVPVEQTFRQTQLADVMEQGGEANRLQVLAGDS